MLLFGSGIIWSAPAFLPTHLPGSTGILGERRGGNLKSLYLTKAGKEFNFLIYFWYLQRSLGWGDLLSLLNIKVYMHISLVHAHRSWYLTGVLQNVSMFEELTI